MNRNDMQVRCLPSDLKVRADTPDEMVIEGYFIVFNRRTELWPGAFEEVAPESVDGTLGNDIRALRNHDTAIVLGRNKSGTLELRKDDHGLWGSVKINKDDADAVSLYARVKRGDVDQCSFGFNIRAQETDWRDDGTVLWRLTDIDLREVSIVTFPAYEDTSVQARMADFNEHETRKLEQRKQALKERTKQWH